MMDALEKAVADQLIADGFGPEYARMHAPIAARALRAAGMYATDAEREFIEAWPSGSNERWQRATSALLAERAAAKAPQGLWVADKGTRCCAINTRTGELRPYNTREQMFADLPRLNNKELGGAE